MMLGACEAWRSKGRGDRRALCIFPLFFIKVIHIFISHHRTKTVP